VFSATLALTFAAKIGPISFTSFTKRVHPAGLSNFAIRRFESEFALHLLNETVPDVAGQEMTISAGHRHVSLKTFVFKPKNVHLRLKTAPILQVSYAKSNLLRRSDPKTSLLLCGLNQTKSEKE
jgi:hypothetical protein